MASSRARAARLEGVTNGAEQVILLPTYCKSSTSATANNASLQSQRARRVCGAGRQDGGRIAVAASGVRRWQQRYQHVCAWAVFTARGCALQMARAGEAICSVVVVRTARADVHTLRLQMARAADVHTLRLREGAGARISFLERPVSRSLVRGSDPAQKAPPSWSASKAHVHTSSSRFTMWRRSSGALSSSCSSR